MTKKIAIAGFHHETNTFSKKRAEYEDFEKADGWPALSQGKEIYKNLKGTNIPIAGFIDQAKKYDWDLVPATWCNAPPSSFVATNAYGMICDKIVLGIEEAGKLDAIFLDLHGAMVVETFPDGEGELLRRIREVVGGEVPIVVALDLHANITSEMVKLSNLIVGYRTYPHVDMAETGARCADHLNEIFSKNQEICHSHQKLPFLIPITAQCTLIEPCKSVMEKLKDIERQDMVLSASFFTGFPPADINQCGPSILVYGWNQDLIYQISDLVFDDIVHKEKSFEQKLWSCEAAVHYANQHYDDKPFILADTQDNPGAGADSNNVDVLYSLLESGIEGAVVACIYDKQTAERANRVGAGSELFLSFGEGESGPIEDVFKVLAVNSKPFKAKGEMYKGNKIDLGDMALLELKGVKIIVISKKMQAADRAILEALGVDPEKQRIIVLKSSVHFRADFQEMAEDVLIIESSGQNVENPENLPYKHLRKGVRLKPNGRALV